MMRNIILIGAPGVGKGTFAKIIAKQTGWKHICVGDILRQEVRNGTTLGKEIGAELDKGNLLPDKLINSIANKHLQHLDASYVQTTSAEQIAKWGKAVLLDGYPRTLGQATSLTQRMINTNDKCANVAVHIALEPWVAVQKLLHRSECATCGDGFNTADVMSHGYDMPAILPSKSTCRLGASKCDPVLVNRNDDKEDIIASRMKEYGVKTMPIVHYYVGRGELAIFDVKKGVKDTPQLLQLMNERLSA
jgi:adenylate kinase